MPIVAYLRSRGRNISQERFIILYAIFQQPFRRHFKAEELVNALCGGPQSVSRATIYRTLKILEDAGIVRSMPESCQAKPQKSYEILDQNNEHGHLICRFCGRVTEYQCREIIERQDSICRQHDFQPEKRIEQIYGICARCRK